MTSRIFILLLLGSMTACSSIAIHWSKESAFNDTETEGLTSQAERIQYLFPDGAHRLPYSWERSSTKGTEQTIVSAAWFGYNALDSTAALQAAIDSGARVIVVPAMPTPWILSSTVYLRGWLELIFESGCRIEAAQGAFQGTGEALFAAQGTGNLHISGYGASWTMRKTDYQKAPYEPSQWRHALSLRAVTNSSVVGLTITSSGGDGVYIGTLPVSGASIREPCSNVTLTDLKIADHHRQGISVTSAQGLLIQRCTISGTRGVLPGAGIDFEPNSRDPGFANCVVSHCNIKGNAGPGILVALGRLPQPSTPISIRIEDTSITGQAIAVSVIGAKNGHTGSIELQNCLLSGLSLSRNTSTLKVTTAY